MDEAGIYAVALPGLDRHAQIGVASGRVLRASYPGTPDTDAGSGHPILEALLAYLEGESVEPAETPVALTMATDRRAVLERLRSVPYGTTVTVAELARTTPGIEDEEGTVRQALASNPVPPFVPDHRVRDGPSGAPEPVAAAFARVEGL